MASPNILYIPGSTARELVKQLAVPHRHKYALRRLMQLGTGAADAVREGLLDDDPGVRVGCCRVLDRFMDEAALPELIENLEHPDPEVRSWALHALACDRCKQGVCRPGEADVVPRVADMLRHDDHRDVRKMAAGMLGPSVHRSVAAADAILLAFENDACPVVRKVAGWWIPGGSRWTRTRPHS